MKLTIKQSALLFLITRGGEVAQAKGIIPALEYFRLTASNGHLALASSDMDRFAEAVGQADIETPGALLVPATAFKTLINKHAKGADIYMEADGRTLTVKAGRSTVCLPTLPAEDFPAWADTPPTAEFVLSGEDFARTFQRVRFAAAGDNHPNVELQGICIDASPGESMNFVATDTYRFAMSSIPMPEGGEACPRAIVPVESVDAALTVFKDAAEVHVAINEKAASFAADGLRLSGRLIAKLYPDYRRIMPSRGDHPTATFQRSEFVDCLERANVMTGKEGTTAAIAFEPDGNEIHLRSQNHSGGSADEALSGEITDGFKTFRFNPRYAASFLATLAVSEMTIEQVDPTGPHLIHSPDAPDFLGLLMPVGKK